MTPPDISIVILNWNDRQHMEICLESLQSCTKSRSVEIIVVDNGSSDGSPEMVVERFPEVQLIRNEENIGFPKGNNTGIRASKGRYVFVLNSDIKVLDNCVDALVDYLETHADVGMIGPRILNADLTLQSSCRRFPTLWNNFCSAFGLARIFEGTQFFSGEHMLYFKGDRIVDVDVLVGCFWLVRRAAIDEFGLLDEGFFIYAEDVDWCVRCWKAGWRVVFFPDAQAIHYRGVSTTKKDPVRFALTQQTSVLRYWEKHHGAFGRFAMACLLFGHLLVRWAATIAKGTFGSSRPEEQKTRVQVTKACLRALFSASPKEV
jgi:GT2 family glycosyltransferase